MTNTAQPNLSITEVPAIARVSRRLIPFLWVLYIVNYLDRTNVAMAKLTLMTDARLSETAYGLGAGLFFFIGYIIFEVPSNLILHRIGARRWIGPIMIAWGICSAATSLTRGPVSFYALRFLLGLAEAGFFPGVIFYLTLWIPARQRTRTLGVFLTGIAMAGVIGSPLAGLILKLDGTGGLHGWQWLFILEGIAPVLLGILILMTDVLPDRPADAAWLTADQARELEDQLHAEREQHSTGHKVHLRDVLDGRLVLLGAIYFALMMGLYGLAFWVPSIVKGLTSASNAMVGLVSAIPFAAGAVGMIAIGSHADRQASRRYHVAACMMIATVGFAVLASTSGRVPGLIALSVAAVGVFGSLGPFWAIPSRYLRGTAAAGGIAAVNSAGALAGYVAPYAIGKAKDMTGSFAGGLFVVAGSLAIGSLLAICVNDAE
jgi:ACS family tartrate transporter-like MFS transporter